MESVDFIKLASPTHSNCQVEDTDYEKSQAKETSLSTSKIKASNVNHIEAEDSFDGSKIEGDIENIEDSQHVQDMDLEKGDFMPKLSILEESVHLGYSFSTVDRVDTIETKFSTNISTNSVSHATMNNLIGDESPITGAKRARTTSNDQQQPSVRVVYNYLTRESKKMLMELMQQWSQWQGKHQSSSNVSGKVALESGEDTYFAALHVGSEGANAVSFWLDNQSRKEDTGDSVKLDGDMVPLYDRGFTLGLTTLDGSSNSASGLHAADASRCFNCGSYSHALKDCSKPRDNIAISNARKQHSSNRNQNTGSRSQNRYYQKTSGKFDDLKAGVLGAETRECLGIGELDPPPWLHRMRELGYPPGYLDNVEEDQPSGITIFADEEKAIEREEGELSERLDPAPPKKRTTVEFPGINAPIPEKADNWIWATPSSSYNSSSHSNRPSDLVRGRCQDQTEFKDRQDNGPPGSGQGPPAFSRPGYSRYTSQDHNSIPRSPSLGRSLSDRNWQSPALYETPPLYSPRSPHSPHPIANLAWQSPQYHHSPAGSGDHWSQETSYRSSAEARERDPHKQEHYRSYHRR